MRTRCLVAVMLLGALGAWGQTAEPDASVPDASAGQGGVDQTSEENDPNTQPCLASSECEHGFTCSAGRCVPSPVKNASCGGAPLGMVMLAVGLAGAQGLRRRR
jgi:hypothetical protein